MRNTTEKAYHTDLRRFIDWGGSVPSCPSVVAEYLLAHAETHKYYSGLSLCAGFMAGS